MAEIMEELVLQHPEGEYSFKVQNLEELETSVFEKLNQQKNLVVEIRFLNQKNEAKQIEAKLLVENNDNINQIDSYLYINLINQSELLLKSCTLFYQWIQRLKHLKHFSLMLRSQQIKYDKIYLFEGISSLINLTSLDLDVGNTQLGDEGVIRLGEELQKCVHLSNLKLEIFTNKITNIGAIELGIFISKCRNLTQLYLDIASNSISEGQLGLVRGINLCPKLRDFYLMIYGTGYGYDLSKPLCKSKSLVKFYLILNF
ncbi:cyclic nucleotide-binding domain protein (macronuclear) [Tetrahymena thermophila SB210]|uniref:Cyclic nucleotide-binding domain protein n=1 Tax=Tetrahymena thermophila (strain SB210) TaxID=312017 RepID=I7MIV8_TETTS|nr:cyclic nucleotide-binding domain protein [Tetrahymena thermophila SB210]EAR95016.2 cyclic nucleotide-binding domain protein [Tetrahymena thermophila SB210]|eukprot:XP_001015261.2 cyclic nucleotide-binding domain protein [Tetrahymena thermophila SB210]